MHRRLATPIPRAPQQRRVLADAPRPSPLVEAASLYGGGHASPRSRRGASLRPCRVPRSANKLQPRPHRPRGQRALCLDASASSSFNPLSPAQRVKPEWWGPLTWNGVLARAATSSNDFSLFSVFYSQMLTWLCYRELITARCRCPKSNSRWGTRSITS